MIVKTLKKIESAFIKALASTVEQIFLKNSMHSSEAIKILNLNENFNHEELNKKYKHLYDINSKEKNGSVYIQTKIYEAFKKLEEEYFYKVN